MKIEYERLPNMEKLSTAQTDDDLFVCALGFEDRCIAAPAKLKETGYKSRCCVYLTYDSNKVGNEKNKGALLSHLSAIAPKVIESQYVTDDPLVSINRFLSVLDGIKQDDFRNVTIDISSFTSSAIIQIIGAVMNLKTNQIRIIYSEAEEYYPKEDELLQEDYLTYGLKDVFTLPGYGGIHSAGYPQMLITFLGFSAIRAKGVYNWYQPHSKIGLIGMPPRPDRNWRARKIREIHERYFSKTNDKLEELTTFDYKKVLNKLETIYDEYSRDYNIGVAPMGSKMQAIATLLFLKKHVDVQVIISLPNSYDERYSEGIGPIWQLTLEPQGE